jgi:hypothetical protein
LKGFYSSLKLRSPTTLQATFFADSGYASDKNDHKSTSGCVAKSSATPEIKLVTSFIEDIRGKPPPLPSLLNEDNSGAIYMAKNIAVGQRTKHDDICTRFTNDMVKDGKLKIIFISSANNPAEETTKNIPSALHRKHFYTIVWWHAQYVG